MERGTLVREFSCDLHYVTLDRRSCRTDTEAPPSFDTYRLHAALTRSTDASLGSIALSALLLTLVRMLTLFSTILRRAPLPFLPFMTLPLHFIDNATGALSTLALVYVGLTGDAFFPSARRARTLTNLITRSGGKVKYRQSGADRKSLLVSDHCYCCSCSCYVSFVTDLANSTIDIDIPLCSGGQSSAR